MWDLFADPSGGALYYSPKDSPDLITRPKDGDDNALPSANSVAISNLCRLAELTWDDTLRHQATALLRAFGEKLEKIPLAFPQMLCSLDFYLGKVKEVVLIAPRPSPPALRVTEDLLEAIHKLFVPHKVVLWAEAEGSGRERMEKLSALLEAKTLLDGKPTVYVCEDRTCKRPVNEAVLINQQLT
jgi:uncharacterized protein YyaL (SSP411 family)